MLRKTPGILKILDTESNLRVISSGCLCRLPYIIRVCVLLVPVDFSLSATYSNYDVYPGMM